MRIGHGYDVHRFCEGKFLTIGGTRISHTRALDCLLYTSDAADE